MSPQIASQPANTPGIKPLKGTRVLSLALNLPGPAALMRCRDMGATCIKLEPPAPAGTTTSDPMGFYNPEAYAFMHQGIKTVYGDLKTDKGRAVLHRELAKADVLLTSFRPSALVKLGLGWKELHKAYPQLSMVAIVGTPGARAEEPGHDLTYMAENNLVSGLNLPPSLYADMGGSLLASEAILQTRLHHLQKGKAVRIEVALSDSARYLGLPNAWGLTKLGSPVGGSHAGYAVYACKNGRVALAALEPHFAAALADAAGLPDGHVKTMMRPETRTSIAAYMAGKTRQQLEKLAVAKDIPLHTLPAA
jgi:crotonobetainyl-CoA:carnitine CoA-transferase CaiB-like acyl-CoA transferase